MNIDLITYMIMISIIIFVLVTPALAFLSVLL